MRSLTTIFLALVTVLLAACDLGGTSEEPNVGFKEERLNSPAIPYIKAAHYFSDTAPFNFWQDFEEHKLEGDIKKIKDDGFNTIILVLPWKGFAPDSDKPKESIRETLYQRFEKVLSEIVKQNLYVFIRLGYPHNFIDKADSLSLCPQLFTNSGGRQHWRAYLEQVRTATAPFDDQLLGVFISWEDFWCPHFIFSHGNEKKRIELAKSIGYADWLISADLASPSETVSIPTQKLGGKMYAHYSKFIDQQMNDLILTPAREVFGKAAMEIRIDRDRSQDKNGKTHYFDHYYYYEEPNYRGVYWGPYWGETGDGQKISARKALRTFKRFLKTVSNKGRNTKFVLEQLNFVDNTPGFEHTASIADDQLKPFFEGAVPLLKKYTQGYGLWAYRNYAENLLHNSSFELDLDGWQHDGASVIKGDGDNQILLEKSGYISQSFIAASRVKYFIDYKTLTLCIYAHKPSQLSLQTPAQKLIPLTLQEGENCIQIPAEEFIIGKPIFKLIAEQDAHIDEIKLYGFIQDLGVYDHLGKASQHLEMIRNFNERLQ